MPDLLPLPGLAGDAMSRSEITFDHWAACAADGACAAEPDDHGWGRGNRPVINVSWDDANAYAAWLSKKIGRPCRLPTEAEWERAASGGAATAFWWGDDLGRGMANCRDCGEPPVHGTLPAGVFPANPYGFVDMNGNVWEWTSDCWAPRPDGYCVERVIKGGSWYFLGRNATTRARAPEGAANGSYNIGIRIVCGPSRQD